VAHYNFALALYRFGVFGGDASRTLPLLRRALAEFEESYRLKPEIILPPYQMGNCYYRLGDKDLAKARWEEACELDSESPEPLSNLGVLEYELGDQEHREAAVKKWQRAVQLNPELVPTAGFLDAIANGKVPKLAICEAQPETPAPPADKATTAA
jgi:tetratricopeptide (TPR) repeat protein